MSGFVVDYELFEWNDPVSLLWVDFPALRVSLKFLECTFDLNTIFMHLRLIVHYHLCLMFFLSMVTFWCYFLGFTGKLYGFCITFNSYCTLSIFILVTTYFFVTFI